MSKKKQQTKLQKLVSNFERTIKQFIEGSSYRPMTGETLLARLSIPPQHHDLFIGILKTMVNERILDFSEGRYQLPSSKEGVVAGLIRMHPRGFGFVETDEKFQINEDIFIPKHATLHAVDGDRVEVLVDFENVSEKGPEGRVIAILERGRTHMAGIIRAVEPSGLLIAYAPLLGKTKRLEVEVPEGEKLTVGDRIVVEMTDWGSDREPATCRFSHKIGSINDPSCDIPAAIEEYEIRADFPQAVKEQAEAVGVRVPQEEIKKRVDFRDTEVFTIDPDTAKDYDDALSLSKDEKGHYHLAVHIADVTHYVQPGSPIDKEAKIRCNSTYFPGMCVPMIPGELSNNLCSLKADVNRLTASVLMEFDPAGALLHYRIVRGVINSKKRFTYKEAKAVLDGKKKSPHLPTLQLMVELCLLLKKQRYERGSIEFSMPELVVLVDEKGIPTGTDYVEYDITHQLVEEFMLKANEVVATHLSNQGKPLTFRIHDEPAEENMKDFAILARAFGYEIPDLPSMQDLQKLFDQAHESPFAPFLATSFIRRLRLASYSADNIGHFGLALTHYCHFTSPIRRYADLVVHRILFGDDHEYEHVEEIALRCSEQERISARAEGSVTILKKLRLLQAKPQEATFEAVVTRIKPFGFFFEILDLMLESFFHVSELDEDFFTYDEGRMQLLGRHTGTLYQPGDKIVVGLSSIDLILQETKWYLIPEEHTHARSKSKPKKKKRR